MKSHIRLRQQSTQKKIYLHYTATYTIAFAHFVLEQNQEV